MKTFSIVAIVLLVGGFAASALIAAAVVVAVSMGGSHGTRLTYPSGEVYYKDTVSTEEAQKFADYMHEQWSEHENFVTFQLERDQQIHTVYVRMSAKAEAWETNQYDASFMALELLLEKDVFPGENVVYELCDDRLVPQKSLDKFPIEDKDLDSKSIDES